MPEMFAGINCSVNNVVSCKQTYLLKIAKLKMPVNKVVTRDN